MKHRVPAMRRSTLQSLPGSLLSWLCLACVLALTGASSHGQPHRRKRDDFDWDDRTVLAFCALLLFVPVGIVLTIWMWLRRNKHPIRGRTPVVVTACHVCLLLYVANLSIIDMLHEVAPCWYSYWSAHLLSTMTSLLYAVRAWMLYFRHGVTFDRLEEAAALKRVEMELDATGVTPGGPETPGKPTQQEDPPQQARTRSETAASIDSAGSAGSKGSKMDRGTSWTRPNVDELHYTHNTDQYWFMQRRYMGTERFAAAVIMANFAMNLVAPIAVSFLDDEISSGDESPCSWRLRAVFSTAPTAVYTLVFMVLAWRIRGIVDAYKIKEELVISAILGAIVVCELSVIGLSKTAEDSDANYGFFVAQCIIFLIFCTSCVWPLYRSYRQLKRGNRGRRKSRRVNRTYTASDLSSVSRITLEEVLGSLSGIAAFEGFLASEFAVEHLLFYRQVVRFRDGFAERTLDENFNYAENIYKQFLARNAKNEVNLSGDLVEDTRDILMDTGLPVDDLDEQAGGSSAHDIFGTRRRVSRESKERRNPFGSPIKGVTVPRGDADVLEAVRSPVAETKEDVQLSVPGQSDPLQVSVIGSPVDSAPQVEDVDIVDPERFRRVSNAKSPMHANLFEAALADVVDVLRHDSFPRFRSSKLFESVATEIILEIQQSEAGVHEEAKASPETPVSPSNVAVSSSSPGDVLPPGKPELEKVNTRKRILRQTLFGYGDDRMPPEDYDYDDSFIDESTLAEPDATTPREHLQSDPRPEAQTPSRKQSGSKKSRKKSVGKAGGKKGGKKGGASSRRPGSQSQSRSRSSRKK